MNLNTEVLAAVNGLWRQIDLANMYFKEEASDNHPPRIQLSIETKEEQFSDETYACIIGVPVILIALIDCGKEMGFQKKRQTITIYDTDCLVAINVWAEYIKNKLEELRSRQ